MSAKKIPDPGFAGDHGDADPDLAEALRAWSAARSVATDGPADLRTLARAVAIAAARVRLIVPVVAIMSEAEPADRPAREPAG